MKFIKTLAALALLLFFVGCASQAPQKSYTVHSKDGRTFLLATDATRAAFAEHGHLAISKSYIGSGKNGETVIVEVSKEDPTLANRIWAEYEADELSYFEKDYKGRTYIVGSVDSFRQLKVDKHLPICKSFIGAGAKGQTVVVEVKKDDADYANMLWGKYQAKHSMN